MNTTPEKPAAGAPAPTRTPQILASAAAVLAVVAVAVALYAWYRVEVSGRIATGELVTAMGALERTNERLGAEQDTLRDRLDREIDTHRARLEAAISELERDLEEQRRGMQAGLEDRDDRIGRLAESVQRMHAELGRSLDTWTLEEAEQLLVLANHRLRLASDVDLAVTALRIADQRLRDLGDPALDDVRAIVADEILALRSLAAIDVPGAAARLSGLVGQVDRLPSFATPELAAAGAADDALAEDATDWRRVGRAVFEDLAGLVSVRRTDATAAPLLPPDQAWFLRENLRLALQAAQIALLRGDAGTYATQLERASGWVGEHFVAGAEPVEVMQSELAELRTLEIAPELPDISGSLAALRAVMATRAGQ